MIQNVSQIEKEFLIKTVLMNEQPVRFHGISTAGTGLITMMDRSMLAVTLTNTLDDSCFSICEHITGYFDCHGHTYAFESTIRDIKEHQLKIDPPVRLLRSLQRKFVRVRKPRDMSISIHLPNEEIRLGYPICPEYVSVEELLQSEDYDGLQLAEIIGAFRGNLSKICSCNTIIMFRTKKPEMYEETLITETGKVLFIPSTSSELPKNDPYPEGRIVTASIEEQFEDPNYFVEGSKYEKLLNKKKSVGISSEIWCPIVYYQYVVGYIYVAQHNDESFDISMVDRLWDFSRILAYQLKTSGYFAKEEIRSEPVKHKPAIMDMSPGGMLVSLPEGDIRNPVKEGSVFATEISFEGKTVKCTARVIRRYVEKDSVSYGTTFLDLRPQDIMNLYEFLYHAPYTEDNPLAYEHQASANSAT